MQLTIRRVLLAFSICLLPSLGIAAETAPAKPVQASAPVVAPTPQAATPSSVQAPTPPSTATPEIKVTPKAAEAPKSQQLKLGYVDISRVTTESSLGKSSTAQVKQKQEKLQAQIIAKRKQLDRQKASIEAQIAKLPPSEREAKAKEKSREFQKKVESFQKFGMNAEKELQNLQDNLGKAFNESIRQAAMEYGSKNGLSLVVIRQEMLYLSGGVDAQDVSDAIIKIMNEKKTKK